MIRMIIVAAVLAALMVTVALPAFAHEGGNDFVCPVFNSKSAVGDHNPNAVWISDGDPPFYTLLPGGPDKANHLDVPDQATNMNGSGKVHLDPHSAPGDTDYSAIWNGD